MSGSEVGSLVAMAVLLLLSALFSSSEAALLSVMRTPRLAHLVNTGSARAIRVTRMLEEPGRLLTTILLGNNIVNVAFATLVTASTLSLVADKEIAVALATVIATVALLIFGEVIPKNLAVRHAIPFALRLARPLKWIQLVSWPLVSVLQWLSRLVTTDSGELEAQPSITEDELRTLIDIGDEEGVIEAGEAEMLERVFRFGDTRLQEVMTPRTEIVFVEQGASLEPFLDIYVEHPYTRFPVYEGNTDNVIGILSAKDILRAIGMKDETTEVIRDAYFVPETKPIAELFDELRQSGNQMAIAVDEFGGIAGLVTLKRLLEEIVGRVGEEGEALKDEYETLDENVFQVDGGMSIDDVDEELGIKLPEGTYETIAGFVLDSLGHIPVEQEQFDHDGLRIEVTQMQDQKIEIIKLTKGPFTAS
jgi:putative hemolysin